MACGVLTRYGWRGESDDGIARVTAAHGDYYTIIGDATGGETLARTKKSAFMQGSPRPVTGDFVRFDHNSSGESVIKALLPRWSHFARRDPGARRKTQTLAVNFDVLAILMAPGGDYSVPRIARYLSLAADVGEARTVVVLTKTDLAPEWRQTPPRDLVDAVAGRADILCVSAVDGTGMDEMRSLAKPGRTLALLGSSGVGKSTMLNALAGGFIADVQEVQEWSGRGRHTTTARRLYMLDSGAMVVDTPGVREIGAPGEIDSSLAKGASTHRWRL